MKPCNRKLVLFVIIVVATIFCEEIFAKEENEVPIVYDLSKSLVSEDGSISYLDKDKLLRRFTSNDYGVLSVNITNSSTYLVDDYNSSSVRRKYDERMRLISKETWNIASVATDSSMSKKENYTYNQLSGLLTTVVLYDYLQKKMQQTDYNEDGLKINQNTYAYDDEKGSLLQSLLWKYDSNKRVIENQSTDYNGKKTTSQKEIFTYSDSGDQITYAYYENNSLRIKREFVSSQNYTETAYFDGGFSVETIFLEGTKTESSLFYNGKFQNRTVYGEE